MFNPAVFNPVVFNSIASPSALHTRAPRQRPTPPQHHRWMSPSTPPPYLPTTSSIYSVPPVLNWAAIIGSTVYLVEFIGKHARRILR